MAALETVLDWLLHPNRVNRSNVVDGLRPPLRIDGRERSRRRLTGRSGRRSSHRTTRDLLIEWQWPDGGWNCDVGATEERSSFHESHLAAWGLHEYSHRDRRQGSGRGGADERPSCSSSTGSSGRAGRESR